ncbi:MAG: PASTA domain-containing protein [Pseudonocardia sp.]
MAVPDVVGELLSDAQAELEARGFGAAVSRATTTDPREVGRVISQSPSAGSGGPRGSSVRLVVGRLPGTN